MSQTIANARKAPKPTPPVVQHYYEYTQLTDKSVEQLKDMMKELNIKGRTKVKHRDGMIKVLKAFEENPDNIGDVINDISQQEVSKKAKGSEEKGSEEKGAKKKKSSSEEGVTSEKKTFAIKIYIVSINLKKTGSKGKFTFTSKAKLFDTLKSYLEKEHQTEFASTWKKTMERALVQKGISLGPLGFIKITILTSNPENLETSEKLSEDEHQGFLSLTEFASEDLSEEPPKKKKPAKTLEDKPKKRNAISKKQSKEISSEEKSGEETNNKDDSKLFNLSTLKVKKDKKNDDRLNVKANKVEKMDSDEEIEEKPFSKSKPSAEEKSTQKKTLDSKVTKARATKVLPTIPVIEDDEEEVFIE